MSLAALVWKRSDFRESSRVVTLWSRERGRLHALAKGAHRANSVLLGKIDFLNRVEVTLSGRGMPILGRTRLVHEPRKLREPRRFLIANYLVDLFDRTLTQERADRELYDLCDGGLTLVERAPVDRLPGIVAGLELRLLATLGELAPLDACSQCGAEFTSDSAPRITGQHGGVFCHRHAPRSSSPIDPATLAELQRYATTPGRHWPSLEPSRALGSGFGVLARWISLALEDLPRSRRNALRALTRGAAV